MDENDEKAGEPDDDRDGEVAVMSNLECEGGKLEVVSRRLNLGEGI